VYEKDVIIVVWINCLDMEEWIVGCAILWNS